MMGRMYEIIELISILNRLTNEFYEDDYTKENLLEMMDNMQNAKYSYERLRGQDSKVKGNKYNNYSNYKNYEKKDGILEKIIYYLKSLNGD